MPSPGCFNVFFVDQQRGCCAQQGIHGQRLDVFFSAFCTLLLFCVVISSMSGLIRAGLPGRHGAKITVSTSNRGTEHSTVNTSLVKVEQRRTENIFVNV